ncbi:hypothetical protein I2I11_14695 [Pontibacter sp. 172403-2]|uniref:hypothetical protein n=1 Tax=Pontibacter rufus TaxID=2791028 RepID=UPI0018B000F7|nr:hypothetical protein [Pontibacter sp. 172403-2]MBF9254550.1 hypothetical protein [Pontibacter sp. 172403-2]
MSHTYKPVAQEFRAMLAALAARKSYVRIQFFSDIHEFFTRNAIVKGLYFKGEEEYLELLTGEQVRLDRIVRVGDIPAPGYDDDYFKCDVVK